MRIPRIIQTRCLRALSLLVLATFVVACSGLPMSATSTPRPEGATAVVSSAAPTATAASSPRVSTLTPTTLPPAALSPTPRLPTRTATRGGTPRAASPAASAATASPIPRLVGPDDPSNGPLKKHRLVTYYGHPYSDRMGILGEHDPAAMIGLLKQQAAAYTRLDPSRPALPTIELIASVAQDRPGPDGLYLQRTPPEEIADWVRIARDNDCLLLLDIQIGLDTVANEIEVLRPFLKEPHVHLAIDPEFAVKSGQTPGEDFGSITAADIMYAGKVLGEIVRQHNLPDKVLLVHQFVPSMIVNKDQLKAMPNAQLVITMDGFGPPAMKIEGYEILVRDELIQYGGVKLFYRQDEPLMTEAEILDLDPQPMVIIYQ